MKAGSRLWGINVLVWFSGIMVDRVRGNEVEVYQYVMVLVCIVVFVLLGYTDND